MLTQPENADLLVMHVYANSLPNWPALHLDNDRQAKQELIAQRCVRKRWRQLKDHLSSMIYLLHVK